MLKLGLRRKKAHSFHVFQVLRAVVCVKIYIYSINALIHRSYAKCAAHINALLRLVEAKLCDLKKWEFPLRYSRTWFQLMLPFIPVALAAEGKTEAGVVNLQFAGRLIKLSQASHKPGGSHDSGPQAPPERSRGRIRSQREPWAGRRESWDCDRRWRC